MNALVVLLMARRALAFEVAPAFSSALARWRSMEVARDCGAMRPTRIARCSRSLPPPTTEQRLLSTLRAHLAGKESVAVHSLSSQLSDADLETLAEEYGGLAAFCRRHPNTLDVKKLADGKVYVSQLPRVRKPTHTTHPKAATAPPPTALSASTHPIVVTSTTLVDEGAAVDKYPARIRPPHQHWKSTIQYAAANVPQITLTIDSYAAAWGLCTVEKAREHALRTAAAIEAMILERAADAQWCDGESKPNEVPSLYHFMLLGFQDGELAVVGPGLLLPHNVRVESPETSTSLEPGQFELWRLGRFLSTGAFTPIQPLRSNVEGSVLGASLLHVLLAYPKVLQLLLLSRGSAPWDPLTAASEALSVVHRIGTEAGAATRIVVHEIIGVRFLLSAAAIRANLEIKTKLSHLTDEELKAESQAISALWGFRRARQRQLWVKETIKRRFPHGTALMEPEVMAYFIYDSMQPGVVMNHTEIREKLLPEQGRTGMHIPVTFFDNFPSLFITSSISSTSVRVMRRDIGMEELEGDESKKHVFSKEDIALHILSALCASSRPAFLSTLLQHLTHPMRRFLRATGLQVKAILEEHPDVFVIEPPKNASSGVMVRLAPGATQDAGMKLADTVRLRQPSSDGRSSRT